MTVKIKDFSPRMRIASMENELYFPASFQDQTTQLIGGLTAGSQELTHGKIHIQGVAERILFGDATEPLTGLGVFIGKDGEDYEFRVGDPAGIYLHWNGAALSITGFVPSGGAAADVNANVTTISGGKITTNSVTTNQLNFVPLVSTNTSTAAIIATINASAEGITIAAAKIAISGATTFSSGYDPSGKLAAVGGSYSSAASGARVLIFPDASTGLQIIDDAGADVLKILVGGTDVGDLIIGNYAGNKGLKWDKSAATFTVRGKLITESSSSIGASYLDGDVAEARITLNVLSALQSRLSGLGTNYLSAIAANIGTITSGTITGVTVNSSSGDNKIVLDTGDYIRFYLGGSLRGSLRGASATGATGIIADCDLVIANSRSFMMKSSGGGATEYSGLGLATNDMWLTLGTANKLYVKNNAQNYNYFTVSSSQIYSGVGHEFGDWTQFDADLNVNDNMIYGIKYLRFNTASNSSTSGTMWFYNGGGSNRYFRGRMDSWNGQFDMTGF